MDIISLSRLSLHHFRNYQDLQLEIAAGSVVITGHNGAGKTNILESISLLSPGKGLRGASLSEMDYQGTNRAEAPTPWAISAALRTKERLVQVGTGRDRESNKRILKIDGQFIRRSASLTSLLSVVWLTPQMDLLFISGASSRRKFLDRLVYHFDPEHAERVSHYEQTMRERARLLKEKRFDPTWLTILEEKMAGLNVAIAISRLEVAGQVQQVMEETPSLFPRATLKVEGVIENRVGEMPALQLEEWAAEQLAANRQIDAASGRTNTGVHRSDLLVSHPLKNRLAAYCSTGEQKSLLLSITLAHVRARMRMRQSVPIVLLDEVVAHLDEEKREALLSDLETMKAQIWLTGTDEQVFHSLKGKAQFFKVEQGKVTGQAAFKAKPLEVV